jgi:aldehyde dehydrogenase (NAD+)
MREYLKFYIDGKWVDPVEPKSLDVDNPTTEQVSGKIALGTAADVDKAVKAARKAFATWSLSSREERLDLLQAILDEYQKRSGDLGEAVSEEMGAPPSLGSGVQVYLGLGHLNNAIDALKNYAFEEPRGATLVIKEPIGVCGLITPWNWPINQIACKVYPALATGCTMVLKPSEVAPYSAQIFTEVMDAAGVPAGVYNLVYGDGAGVGVALSSHPDIDMVSFTGSTRAGIDVAKNAAATVKRVTQELGGKSPNIVLDDADFAKNVATGVAAMMPNSGQSCNAFDLNSPFGGYKRSGNGREWSEFGFDEYLEIKGTLGYAPQGAAG